jgi:methyl-accepting chemotaxis protein
VASGAKEIAGNAKTALIAAGATAAGVAGAIVLARSNRSRKVLGVKVPRRKGLNIGGLMPSNGGVKSDAKKLAGSVNDAAKRADRFGKRVSRVASSVQKMSEAANEAAKEA